MQIFVTMLTATAVLFAVGSGASASGNVVGTNATPETVTINLTAVPQADSPEIHQLTNALRAGQQVVLQTTGGRAATLAVNNGTVAVLNMTGGPTSDEAMPYSWCASSYAVAFFALGAIALGALAAAAALSGGTVLIAGAALSAGQLGALAGLSGSMAGYYAWAESHLCS